MSNDDQVKAYIKKIISQLNRWMVHGKISKLVVVITSKETGEHVERWQFDVHIFNQTNKDRSTTATADKENSAPRSGSHPHAAESTADFDFYFPTVPTRLRRLRPKRQKPKFKKKSKQSSGRSLPQLPSYQSLMETAPSMSLSTPMPTPTCR